MTNEPTRPSANVYCLYSSLTLLGDVVTLPLSLKSSHACPLDFALPLSKRSTFHFASLDLLRQVTPLPQQHSLFQISPH